MVTARPHKGTTIMAAVTKEQVLGALAKVAAPSGKPLTEAGVLSDVVVSDGKVFFSITVDAVTVKAWEPVRAAAEAAVKAVEGVKSALVALTAERAAGASRGPQPAHTRQAPRRGSRAAVGIRMPATITDPVAIPTLPHLVRPAARNTPASPASTPSSRLLPAKAASANPPPRSISRSACAISV
jgi:metal-sulfur cluster biosynthetic enzyme